MVFIISSIAKKIKNIVLILMLLYAFIGFTYTVDYVFQQDS